MSKINLEVAFTYHRPFGDQPARYEDLRESGLCLAHIIENYCPPSRERTNAIERVEEAIFWANASIARNERPSPGENVTTFRRKNPISQGEAMVVEETNRQQIVDRIGVPVPLGANNGDIIVFDNAGHNEIWTVDEFVARYEPTDDAGVALIERAREVLRTIIDITPAPGTPVEVPTVEPEAPHVPQGEDATPPVTGGTPAPSPEESRPQPNEEPTLPPAEGEGVPPPVETTT